jgi:MerR family copper efflux transcriptional regulator
MKISEASRLSGLPSKTIRYYESIGLFSSQRAENGYREYSQQDVNNMNFLHRSRELGFSLDECRDLLKLYQDPSRASAEVKQVAERRLQQIDQQINHLSDMKKTLHKLVEQCPGSSDPHCAILDELSKPSDTN